MPGNRVAQPAGDAEHRVGQELVVEQVPHPGQRPGRARRRGCSAWSGSPRCAGTSRTRSARSPQVSSSSRAITSDHRIGSSRASSRNAGTTRNVTAVSTPSAPRPTRAASNRPGGGCDRAAGRTQADTSTRPSARTSSRPATWAAMPPTSRPVPWVPVWIAPATVCTWMSPMLARREPARQQVGVEHPQRAAGLDGDQPGRRVHRPDAGQAAGRSSTPSVTATGVNECPVPVIRTVSPSAAALRTSSATSSAERGVAIRRGRADSLPAQFRQVSPPRRPGPARRSLRCIDLLNPFHPSISCSAQVGGRGEGERGAWRSWGR